MQQNLHVNKIFFGLTVLFIFLLSISLFFSPLIITIDSIYGFLAFKGTVATHHFNVLQEVSGDNINLQNELFVAWWSPGQWMFPGMLSLLFGFKFGIASILVTIVASIAGLAGYARLFRLLQFDRLVINLSLLLMVTGYTFFQNFILYQGGEVISFAVFPWFAWYIIKTERLHLKAFIALLLFMILCFVAKTTMIVYCGILIVYKTFSSATNVNRKAWMNVLLMFLAITVLIYRFYLSQGPTPVFFDHFNFDPKDVLIPLSSPLTGVFSLQQLGDKLVSTGTTYTNLPLTNIINAGFLIACIFLIYRIIKAPWLSKNYKKLFLYLYLGVSAFFIVAYLMNADIDYSVRHFKLMSFIFLPALVSLLLRFIKLFTSLLVLLILVNFGIGYIVSKINWSRDRFITNNYFYNNYNIMQSNDHMDKLTYDRVIALDRAITDKSAAIICVEASPNIAMDLHTPSIYVDTRGDFENKVYHNAGPAIYLVLDKNSFTNLDWIKKKFPHYHRFNIIDQTSGYIFYRAE